MIKSYEIQLVRRPRVAESAEADHYFLIPTLFTNLTDLFGTDKSYMFNYIFTVLKNIFQVLLSI